MDQLLGALAPVLGTLVGGNGILLAMLSWMGVLRLIFKPIMTGLLSVADSLPNTGFSTFVHGLVGSKVYTTIAFVLDYVASIKVPAAPTTQA